MGASSWIPSSKSHPSHPSHPRRPSQAHTGSHATGNVKSTESEIPLRDGLSKRVAARGLRVLPRLEPPEDAFSHFFTTRLGRAACWRPAIQTADQFAEADGGLSDLRSVFFSTEVVRVFVPISETTMVVRPVRLHAPVTLMKVLRAVEASMEAAAAEALRQRYLVTAVTKLEALQELKHVTVCNFVIRRAGGANHLYVRISGNNVMQ